MDTVHFIDSMRLHLREIKKKRRNWIRSSLKREGRARWEKTGKIQGPKNKEVLPSEAWTTIGELGEKIG